MVLKGTKSEYLETFSITRLFETSDFTVIVQYFHFGLKEVKGRPRQLFSFSNRHTHEAT